MPAHRLIAGLVAVAALTGCDSRRPSTAPCPSAGAEVSLGRPGLGRPPAWFRTAGGEIRITATGFEHGGPLDPAVGATEVSIGTGTPATWTVTVHEDSPAALTLPPGRYWLTTSNAVEVRLTPCGGAIDEPTPT